MDQKTQEERVGSDRRTTTPTTAPTVTATVTATATACFRCGLAHDGPPPLTWTCSVENGDRVYFCDDCARTHIRSIEGRLDSSWW